MKPVVMLEAFAPRWVECGRDRYGVGFNFVCPTHGDHRLEVFFANPYDGGDPASQTKLFHRSGEGFDDETTPVCQMGGFGPLFDLTLERMVSFPGHWRGWIIHSEMISEPHA